MPLLGWLSGQPAGEDLAVTESGVRARSDNPRSRRPCARLVADSQRSSITSATAPGGPWNAVHHSGRPPGHTRLVGLCLDFDLAPVPDLHADGGVFARPRRPEGWSVREMDDVDGGECVAAPSGADHDVGLFPSDLVGSRPPSMTVWSLVT